MIFELLVAGAFALATLRRFGGTNGHSHEFRLLPELGAESGFGSAGEQSPTRGQFLQHGTLVATLRHPGGGHAQEDAAATQRAQDAEEGEDAAASRAESLQEGSQGHARNLLEGVQSAEGAVQNELAAREAARVVSQGALVSGKGEEGRARLAALTRRAAEVRHHVPSSSGLSSQVEHQRRSHHGQTERDRRGDVQRDSPDAVRGRDRYSKSGSATSHHAYGAHRDGELELVQGGRSHADVDSGLGRAETLSDLPQRLDEGVSQRHRDRARHLRSQHGQATELQEKRQEETRREGRQESVEDEEADQTCGQAFPRAGSKQFLVAATQKGTSAKQTDEEQAEETRVNVLQSRRSAFHRPRDLPICISVQCRFVYRVTCILTLVFIPLSRPIIRLNTLNRSVDSQIRRYNRKSCLMLCCCC